jgi:hypothetical protein
MAQRVLKWEAQNLESMKLNKRQMKNGLYIAEVRILPLSNLHLH